MANAYSQSHVNNNYIQPVNLNLINTVLNSKEQKYNANVAKIDAVIETYAKTDLLREKDRQMLYENINNVIQNFEGVSKLALTNTDTMRQIEQSFQTSITPYLTQQMVNSAKVRKFMNEVSSLKEKSPDKYSDVNMNYALQKAGYVDYMNGESDDLKNLNYTEYTNVMKEIQPDLDKWAKEYGYENFQSLQNVAGNQFYLKEVNGKRLTRDSVKEFLNNRISSDPKLIKQLEIDAWGKFGGLSDNDFESIYKTNAQKQANYYGESASKIETELKNYTKDSPEYRTLEAQLNYAKQSKSSLEDIVNSTAKLDRDKVATNIYAESLTDALANTYSYERIESVKYNDMPLQIAKLEFDQNLKIRQDARQEAELQLKIEKQNWERNVANGLNPDGTGAGISTQLPMPDTGEGDNKSPYMLATQNYDSNYESVRQSLSASDPNFNAKTKTEQDAVISTLIESNSVNKTVLDAKGNSISQYSNEVKRAVDKAKQDKKIITDYTNNIVKDYEKEVAEVYTSFLNRGNSWLNLNNMRGVPTFKDNIQKGKSFSELGSTVKDAIIYEYVRNVKSAGVTSDVQENERLGIAEKYYRQNLTRKLPNGKYLEGLDNSYRGRTNTSNYSGTAIGLAAESLANRVVGVGAEIVEGFGDLATSLFGSEARVQNRANRQTVNQFFNRANELSQQADVRLRDTFVSDQDFGALSRNDVTFRQRLADGRVVDNNFNAYYDAKVQSRNARYNDLFSTYGNRVQTMNQISFSSEVPQNKPFINDIKAIVESQTGKKVAKESTFNYRFNPSTKQYEFDVLLTEKVKREGKDTFTDTYRQETVTVNPSQVSSRLIQRLSPQDLDFSQSIHNPNRETETVVISQPSSASNKNTFINNFISQSGQSMFGQDLINLKSQLSTLFRTPTERFSSVENLVKSDRQRQQLNNLYNANYEVSYLGSIEEGFVPVVTGYLNGKEFISRDLGKVSYNEIRTEQAKSLTSAYYTNYLIDAQQTKILATDE